MATVVKRVFRSNPHRTSYDTWVAISDILTRSNSGARSELDRASGVASSIIADMACSDSPIIVSCSGPQTRIYCVYGDDAIDGANAKEDSLAFDPLQGDWRVSLPCDGEDLDWIQSELEAIGSRITAREKSESGSQLSSQTTQAKGPRVNTEEFMKP